MTRTLLVRRSAGAEPAVRGVALELGTSLPISKSTSVTATGVASSEAFTAGVIGQLKGAQGTHPSTTDTRTTVTGPEDISGKVFSNPVTLTGSGITGQGVAFSKKPTFQDVAATLSDVWFDQSTGLALAAVVGASAATNVTIRRFTGNQFKGDMIDIDGAFVGTVSLYNGFLRPAPQSALTTTTLTGVGIPSSEAFTAGSVSRKNNLAAAGLASSEAFGAGAVVQLGGPNVSTPSSLGPSSPITTTLSAATPAYTVQVKADGTLKRSDTGATITIASTEFTGGTLIIESDTPGTRRTPAASSLQNIRVRSGKLIFRDLNVTTAMGQGEVTDSSADAAIEWQGCTGTMGHWRAVKCTGGGLRFTRSPSGLYAGQNTPAAGAWSAFNVSNPAAPVPTPALRIDNCTAHAASGATGAALSFDRALNVYVGGFDAGSQSTPAGLWPIAVKWDASVVAGGTKLDVQDVYVGKALDGTDSKLSSKAGTPTLWPGVMKRCGIDAAIFPNTAGSRPEIPIWFALTNAVTLATATAANTTNALVVAEHFVLRNAFAENQVNSTARNGATKLQQFEITKTVYDPAIPLSLWTPSDVADTWPNGARRFIHPAAIKSAIGPRPTVAATMPNGTTLVNKSIIDSTWTHMGGIAGDGVLEIVDRKFDPDLMIDGSGTAGKRFKSTIGTGPAASGGGGNQLLVATAVTLDATPRTLSVKNADGSTPAIMTGWDPTGGFGIYSGYFDPAKPNEVDTGIPYRRQFQYTGISGSTFTGVTLVPRPSTTPGASPKPNADPGLIPPGEIIRIIAGVAETFWPHGLPTGEIVDIATGGLTGTGFAVTRVDDYHFSINGQSGVTWNVAGQVGTFTPQTLHAYGLAGTDNSLLIPVGTTLDDTQNTNMGQPVSNVIIQVKSGMRVRLVRCSLPDISFQAQDDTCFIEMVDCDQPITPVPGRYDYDEPGNLGVAGKYDAANQHQQQRMVANTNVIVTAGSLWWVDGLVSFGSHGDFNQGTTKLGSYYIHCHIEHGRDIGSPSSGGSVNRNGIPGTLPKVTPGPHGDIQQWYDVAAPLIKACALVTSAHSQLFSRFEKNYVIYGPSVKITAASGTPIQLTLAGAGQTWVSGDVVAIIDNAGAYSQWTITKIGTGATSNLFTLNGSSGSAARFVNAHVSLLSDLPTVSLDAGTGSAKVTLAGGAKHNFNDGDTMLIKFAGDAALNREWVAKKSGNSAVVAQGSTFTTGGTCVLVHTIHLVIPGVLRSDLLTAKMVDTSDPTRLGPISSKGNVSINISLTATDPWGTTAIVPGELDLVASIRESRIMTIDGPAGTWSMPTPVTAYDIANNAWTGFGQQGAAVPAGTATPTYD